MRSCGGAHLVLVDGEDAAAQVPEEARDDGTDAACADDTRRFTGQVKADEAGEGEVAVAHAVVGAVDFAVECEDERERVLGHGVGGVRRHAHDRDAEAGRGVDVNVVVPVGCASACMYAC